MDENAVRAHFTEIGCVMEDANVIALMWQANDGLSLADRLSFLQQANRKITNLLNLIANEVS
jgi:hypothetical protein